MNSDAAGGPDLTRREFLAVSAGSILAATAGLTASQGAQPWYATMRRCGQLNFNERDPLTVDVNAWADYWASLKIDAFLTNGGGIVAFYPTAVPYHHRSEFLGSRDLLGEVVAAFQRRSIRVVARMDCNYAYEDALRAHPEWFERNRDGSPRPHNESTWLFKTCMFSPYFTEQMPAIYREIATRYPVDGFYTNGWPSTGALELCYCENCQRVFRDEVGGTPPAQTDASSPLYRKYYDVSMRRIASVWQAWQAVATEKRADLVYVGNLGGGIQTVKNVRALADVAHWFNADYQGRAGDAVIWQCAQQGRVAQSVMKGRTITNVTGSYSNSSIVWRHTAKPPAEMTMWMAQTAASGMVPWFHWLGAQPEDQRWRGTGRQFFQWLAANEAHFRNRRSVADIAVVYPQRTIAFSRAAAGGSTADFVQGLYLALLEGRFAFDFVHEDDLGADVLRRYRAVLMPNVAFMTDAHCDAIRAYVAAGGSVLATFETSRYGEWGDARPDFGLGDVFGAAQAGAAIGSIANSYMRIERRTPLTTGFDDTALLPGAAYRVPIRALVADPLTFSIVPGYPAFPPEMVFPRTPRTTEPAAILRERGASRVVYFPGDVDRTLWRSGSVDLSQLLQNTIHWLRGTEAPLVSVRGDGMLEIFAWETEPGHAVHLLNYNTPNMTRPFMRGFSPIGAQQVSLDVGVGRAVRSVRALRAGRDLRFTQRGGVVTFEVPSVVDYEVAAIV